MYMHKPTKGGYPPLSLQRQASTVDSVSFSLCVCVCVSCADVSLQHASTYPPFTPFPPAVHPLPMYMEQTSTQQTEGEGEVAGGSTRWPR